MIRYFGIVGLVVVGFLGCESAFEADDYDTERAEYCDGDVEKCEELKVSSSLGVSSSSIVGLSSDEEKSSTDISSITETSSMKAISSSIILVTSSTENSSIAESSIAVLSSSSEVFSSQAVSSSALPSSSSTSNTMTDLRDNKVYKTVVIGSQTWMAENLNFGTYLEDLGNGTGGSSQYQSGTQKFCYDNNELSCDTLGGLYQWHTAMNFEKECSNGSQTCESQINVGNHQGICPSGWHLPRALDWSALQSFVGGASIAALKLKTVEFSGENTVGFSVLSAAARGGSGGFWTKGNGTYFWTANESNKNNGDFLQIVKDSDSSTLDDTVKKLGFSIRCLKD